MNPNRTNQHHLLIVLLFKMPSRSNWFSHTGAPWALLFSTQKIHFDHMPHKYLARKSFFSCKREIHVHHRGPRPPRMTFLVPGGSKSCKPLPTLKLSRFLVATCLIFAGPLSATTTMLLSSSPQ